MDQLSNFVAYSPQAQAIQDGPDSSSDIPTSRRRLNPAFAAWLMGIPPMWVHPEVTSCEQLGMESYRSKLRSHLSLFLEGQD